MCPTCVNAETSGLHPGAVLAEDFLEPLGLTPEELSHQTGLDRDYLLDLIEGRRDLDASTAKLLAAYFRVGSEFWMELQLGYEGGLATAGAGR